MIKILDRQMTDFGSYSEKLAHGGTLNVRASDWDISYYFPGPDRRYNGKFVRIPGSMVGQYIDAWKHNWAEYERLRTALPATSEFFKRAELGMMIHCSDFRSGVCLDGLHMCVSTAAELVAVIDSYHYAQSRIEDIQAALYQNAGVTKIPAAVQRAAFSDFINSESLEIGHLPPAVQVEIVGALREVRRARGVGMPGSSYRVKNWFGKENANLFIDELRQCGIDVSLEQATFYLSWRAAVDPKI